MVEHSKVQTTNAPGPWAYHALQLETGDAQDRARSDEVPLLLQYWRTILRWKWVIAAIIVSSLALGLIVTLLKAPQYTASARLEISREQENITNVKGLTSEDKGPDLEFYQTQYSLLEARSLAARVAQKLKLAEDRDFFGAFGVDPDGSALFGDSPSGQLTAAQRRDREDRAVELLHSHLTIAPVRGSSLVDVRFTSPSPALSARVANEWTMQFIQSNLDRRFASTADARRFLEERLEQLRARLEQSERDLVGYASNKQIITLGASEGPDGKTRNERTLVASDLEALNDALAEATADRFRSESRAAERGTTAPALVNNAVNALRQRRAEVAAEYARLMIQFEPEYPAAKALASQISTLDQSIAREESRIRGALDTEYREAMQREQLLKLRVEALKSGLIAQRRDSIQYNIYQREVDTNRELYNGLLQRYKEIGVAGVGSNNVAVVDRAEVPKAPSSPNLPLNMMIALMAGLALSGATAFILQQIDEGIKEPGEVSRALGVPLLGSIPAVRDVNVIEALNDQKSAAFEAYLAVQTNLAFSTDHGAPKSFMVTSTRAAEGKTTTSVALALVLGRVGRRVLLIDADMRSPSVHQVVGLENKIGLSNFLTGESDWQKLVSPTSYSGVSIMTTGPQPPNAAELLSGTRMALLIAELAKNYDHVVIDSPPVLGLADAPLISSVIEDTVYVVEADGVRARGIRAAMQRLEQANGHICGVVLTKFDERKAFNDYGYGYGYGYGKDSGD